MPVSVSIRDPGHLEAHRSEFMLAPEAILAIADAELQHRTPVPGAWESFAAMCPEPVGKGGLARIWPWTRHDYWAARPGRTIPSHLIKGRRRPTRSLCVWGFWQDAGHFIIHTMYPGTPAPREIHDAELEPEKLPASIAFWVRHAIIVEDL
jgi:hypothetical protein